MQALAKFLDAASAESATASEESSTPLRLVQKLVFSPGQAHASGWQPRCAAGDHLEQLLLKYIQTC